MQAIQEETKVGKKELKEVYQRQKMKMEIPAECARCPSPARDSSFHKIVCWRSVLVQLQSLVA